jgi:type IV secretion system protein TrbC
MQITLPIRRPLFGRLCTQCRRWAIPSLMFLAALPVYAQTGSDPWDNAVGVLKTAFTGTIAQGLSLVAIVVGGLMFAYGEGHSKKMLAGIVFGVGMAIGAVKLMTRHSAEHATSTGRCAIRSSKLIAAIGPGHSDHRAAPLHKEALDLRGHRRRPCGRR